MTLLGFKTILHKKCRSGKNSEGPAENSWVPDIGPELQIKKNSCQTLGPASKRVLPDLSTFCQTYFFFKKFFNISLSIQYD
jgi:hypothetical protein